MTVCDSRPDVVIPYLVPVGRLVLNAQLGKHQPDVFAGPPPDSEVHTLAARVRRQRHNIVLAGAADADKPT